MVLRGEEIYDKGKARREAALTVERGVHLTWDGVGRGAVIAYT